MITRQLCAGFCKAGQTSVRCNHFVTRVLSFELSFKVVDMWVNLLAGTGRSNELSIAT